VEGKKGREQSHRKHAPVAASVRDKGPNFTVECRQITEGKRGGKKSGRPGKGEVKATQGEGKVIASKTKVRWGVVVARGEEKECEMDNRPTENRKKGKGL